MSRPTFLTFNEHYAATANASGQSKTYLYVLYILHSNDFVIDLINTNIVKSLIRLFVSPFIQRRVGVIFEH